MKSARSTASFLERERKAGLKGYVSNLLSPRWLNYLELSPIVPDTDGIEVISDLWDKPVPLREAQADARWPFQAAASTRFVGYLEFSPCT